MTVIDSGHEARPVRRVRTRHRAGPAPAPRVTDALTVLAGTGLGLAVAMAFLGESVGALRAPGGWLTLAARLCALVGTYLMLIMVVLMSRIPWIERSVGQDRLVQWHRRIGGWPIVLIATHIFLVTWGYAQSSSVSFLKQLWTFVIHYPDIPESLAAFVLLVTAGVSSARIARQRLKYETWWRVHLCMYLALGLAFFHQIRIGVMFITSPVTRLLWIAITLTAVASIVSFRIILPVWRNLRHQLRVDSVQKVAPDTYAVIVSGRKLTRLAVSGGQFFQWRFMAPGLWWHSHPYSLSALPRPPHMRVTVKGLGDQSRAVARLKPGTRVFVEGPYGTFTRHRLTSRRVVLIGAGVGVTPIRALLEELPTSSQVTVIVRAQTPKHVVHGREFAELVEKRHGQYVELCGPRTEVRLDERTLRSIVGDLYDADVFVCGPQEFTDDVVAAAKRLGAKSERLHFESFAF
ncbi:MAG TPA: ferric reductase-like transmembrane domain-containing protein [Acidimicrobiales bacterium]